MAFATSIFDDAAAWVGVPLVVAITCFGVGLLAERITRTRLPTALLIPTGFCVSVVALLPGYSLGADRRLAAPLLVIGAVAGLVLARRELRERLRPGPAAAAALAVLALYLAPVALSGGWTWAGYNFLNDTSVQMILADQLAHAGKEAVAGPPSTRSMSIDSYLGSGYPLGAHAHLATVATLVGTGVDVAYQGYLASLAMVAALALAGLARRVGLGPVAAAVAAATAVASNLLYQYALQGSIKEVAAAAALLCLAALGRELLSAERPIGAVALVAVAGAAMLSAFSGAAAPYLGAFAVALLAGAFIAPSAVELRRRLVPIAAVGVAVAAVAALPTLVTAVSFLRVATVALAPTAVASSTLGQLARPLEPIQVAGIWLSGNYSVPITSGGLNAITHALAYLAIALALAGIVFQLRRREPGYAMLAFAVAAAMLIVAPRASDYADAKLFAVASPALLFGAMCAALAARGRFHVAGLACAGLLALGVLASDAYAYHAVRLAPIDKMDRLQDAADHTRGRPLVFLNEVEEFGKYYGRHADINTGYETVTPVHTSPQGGGFLVDLDQMEPGFIQRFKTLILRRGADVSRPSANYALTYQNRDYQVWEQRPGIRVDPNRVGLQGPNDGAGVPDCASVRKLAAGAKDGAWLVAASAPDTVTLDVAGAPDRPTGWGIPPAPPGVVQPATPGVVRGKARAAGGTYDIWVRGSSGRELAVRVDGRVAGRAEGINTQGQWLRAGSIELARGEHELELSRPGGDLAPGDGAIELLGPVSLVRRESPGLTWVRPAQAERLCNRDWDWIEVATR